MLERIIELLNEIKELILNKSKNTNMIENHYHYYTYPYNNELNQYLIYTPIYTPTNSLQTNSVSTE